VSSDQELEGSEGQQKLAACPGEQRKKEYSVPSNGHVTMPQNARSKESNWEKKGRSERPDAPLGQGGLGGLGRYLLELEFNMQIFGGS